MTTQHNRFTEIEAAIRLQNVAIKRHQQEFTKVNTCLDDIDNRVLQTLTFCQEGSNNVLKLRQETATNLQSLRTASEDQAAEFRNSFAQMAALIVTLSAQVLTAVARHPSDSSSSSSVDSDHHDQSDRMSTESHYAPPLKLKRTHDQVDSERISEATEPNLKPPPDQDKSAQYTSNRAPDAGAT